jgi:hypothetical protein
MRRFSWLRAGAAVSLLVVAACGSDSSSVLPTTTSEDVTSTTAAPIATVPVVAAATTTTPQPPPADPALREELLEMLVQDQAVRTGIAPPGDTRTEAELFADMNRVDNHNQIRLGEIFDQYGWPGWSLVSTDGSTAAWAVVQHADLDLGFQERGLALLRAAADAGDASKGDLAYLVDRVLVSKGEDQEYGTQWSSDEGGDPRPSTPIRDEAHVDERRASAGLSTLAEYMKELEAAFGPPPTG